MAARVAAGRRDRGGEVVQAARPNAARVALATTALAGCAALAAVPPLRAARYESVLATPGAAALVLVFAALVVGWSTLLPWAVALLGGAYVGSLFVEHVSTDLAAPGYGVALFLVYELAVWSLQERARVRVELRAHVLRAGAVVAIAVLGAAAGFAALAASSLRVSGGLVWEGIGVAAAAAAVALVTTSGRRG